MSNSHNIQIDDVRRSNDTIIVGKGSINEIPNAISREPLFGIDTIKVGFTVLEKDMNFDDWEKKVSIKVKKEEDDRLISISYLKYFPTSNGALMTLKYLPYDYQKCPINLLLIEFSLPRLIFGTNSKNIRDWQYALDCANAQIKKIPGLPHVGDIRDATLYRLDICANFQVGINDIGDYLQVLSRYYYPHRKTTSYLETGVVFGAKELRTSIYDKFQDSGREEMEGCIRTEIQFKSRREVGYWLKEKYPTFRHISLRVIAERFLKELSILPLALPIICDQLEIVKALGEKFSPTQARNMLGYWLMKRTMTREQMIGTGCTSSSISRLERRFKEAGISSNSTDSKKTLPALSRFFPEIEKICNKPLSDTRVTETLDVKKTNTTKINREAEISIFKGMYGFCPAPITIQSQYVRESSKLEYERHKWLKINRAQVENKSTLSHALTSQSIFLSENSVQPKTIEWHKPFY